MGKKKIAVLDLSQSDSPKLKASGTRSQKLTKTKEKKAPIAIPVKGERLGTSSGLQGAKRLKDSSEPSANAKTKTKKRVKHPRSSRYIKAKKLVDKTNFYEIKDAISLLRKISTVKFDASVELHCNLTEDKISGELNLPHGSGKTQKVEIASDKTLGKLKDGIIDFDVLVAEPKIMPKLAKFAKLLGPKGLMPNPKSGTISTKPKEIKKKLAGGATRYKSETKTPLLHLTIGKLSFKDSQLKENIKSAINTIKPKNISIAFLCSSMSPSIKLKIK
ncbi:MAG: hypothetical protein U9Q63_00660 [Patescibacteria group bacterium]|nr:hypothetical protein [Patescibacteria group bacterium]